MPIPTPTVIATGFADAVGCDYQPSHNRLIVADAGNGKLSAVDATTHVSTLLGSGYHSLSDVVVSSDDVHAYVNDRQAGGVGILMRVDLAAADRVHAHVIANVPNQPGQIALDEAHGFAYMPEFASAGHLIRVNLTTGAQTPVASGLTTARGLLITSDGRFAYVSEDTGRVRRFDLVAHTDLVIASGIGGPRYLAFADAGETVILLPAPNPTPGIVLKIDLTTAPATVTEIAVNTPANPFEVAVLSPEKLLITSAQTISQVGDGRARPLASGIAPGVYRLSLEHAAQSLRIGDHRARQRLLSGPPSRPALVQPLVGDAPRHVGDGERAQRHQHPAVQRRPRRDRLGGRSGAQRAGDDRQHLPDGAHRRHQARRQRRAGLRHRQFRQQHVPVRGDRRGGEAPARLEPGGAVGRQSIQSGGQRRLQPPRRGESHLDWHPRVLEPTAPWDAAVVGDPTSTRCAHTFYLSVADRVIDGYYYIHGTVDYHKSITIWL
jgi:hypothetical protein